jgi:hypothetical protein
MDYVLISWILGTSKRPFDSSNALNLYEFENIVETLNIQSAIA